MQRRRQNLRLNTGAAATDPGSEGAKGNSAPNPQAALPNPWNAGKITGSVEPRPEVRVRRGDHMVEPATNDAERDGPDDNVPQATLWRAAPGPATGRQPQACKYSDQDAQGVGVDTEGSPR